MKKLFTLLLLLVSTVVYSGNIANEVNKKQQTQSFINFAPFKNNGYNINTEVLKEVSNYAELGVDAATQGYLVNDKPNNIKLYIPGLNVNVVLYKFEISDRCKD